MEVGRQAGRRLLLLTPLNPALLWSPGVILVTRSEFSPYGSKVPGGLAGAGRRWGRSSGSAPTHSHGIHTPAHTGTHGQVCTQPTDTARGWGDC